MKTYLDIVNDVLTFGMEKVPTRKESGQVSPTIGLPAISFIHDMNDGFPILTSRKIAFKSSMVELEGFIKGVTSKQWYQQRKCRFWDQWANPQKVDYSSEERRLETQLNEDDLGAIYGFQWRHFGEAIDEYDDGVVNGFDQLKYIVETLKTRPEDRRMVCSAWNPNQFSRMALPPCHFGWNIVTYSDTISLIWHQRSCDLMCGVPHNITFYAALLILLAKHSGLRPFLLKGDLNDCHIYKDHIDEAKRQLDRETTKLPEFVIDMPDFDFWNWTANNCYLMNYNPGPKMNFPVVI